MKGSYEADAGKRNPSSGSILAIPLWPTMTKEGGGAVVQSGQRWTLLKFKVVSYVD